MLKLALLLQQDAALEGRPPRVAERRLRRQAGAKLRALQEAEWAI